MPYYMAKMQFEFDLLVCDNNQCTHNNEFVGAVFVENMNNLSLYGLLNCKSPHIHLKSLLLHVVGMSCKW